MMWRERAESTARPPYVFALWAQGLACLIYLGISESRTVPGAPQRSTDGPSAWPVLCPRACLLNGFYEDGPGGALQ